MSEPTIDPPLVTRAADPDPAPPAPSTVGRPGLGEAVLWAAVFVAAQMFGAVLAVGAVFTAYALVAPEPGKFVDEQLAGFAKAVDPAATGERPPVPFEIGQALAWGMLAAQLASLAVILIVLPRRIGPDWKRQIGVRRPHPLHVFLALLIVPGFMICADLVQTLFLMLTGMKTPPALKALNGVFGQYPWPLTVLAVAVGPGVVEELWCRGFLGRGLCARYGLVVGVLFTAVLFSAMHLDPAQLVIIALMGVYLHFVYLATRSIWVPVLLHAANNGLAVFIALVVKPGNEQGEVVVPFIVHLVGFSLLVFGSVALWTSRAALEKAATGEAWRAGDEWTPESPGVSAPPDGAGARLGYEAVSPAALLFALVSFGVLMYLAYRFLQ